MTQGFEWKHGVVVPENACRIAHHWQSNPGQVRPDLQQAITVGAPDIAEIGRAEERVVTREGVKSAEADGERLAEKILQKAGQVSHVLRFQGSYQWLEIDSDPFCPEAADLKRTSNALLSFPCLPVSGRDSAYVIRVRAVVSDLVTMIRKSLADSQLSIRRT